MLLLTPYSIFVMLAAVYENKKKKKQNVDIAGADKRVLAV